jgi:hypothetical protein
MRDPLDDLGGLTRAEFNRLPVEPWQTYFGAVVFGCIGVFAVYQGVTLKIGQFPIYLWLAVGVACLSAGGALLWARDIRAWPSMALLQVFMGCAVGALSFLASEDAAGKWGGLIGAVVVIADGLKKFRDLTAREKHGDAE